MSGTIYRHVMMLFERRNLRKTDMTLTTFCARGLDYDSSHKVKAFDRSRFQDARQKLRSCFTTKGQVETLLGELLRYPQCESTNLFQPYSNCYRLG